jgi:glycosyltransferase involved in cell wall biosynthesis
MKIGFDAKRAFNNSSGLGNYSRWLIRAMATHYTHQEYFLFTPSIHEKYYDCFSDLFNVQVVSPHTLLGRTFSSLWRTYAIADMCSKLELDVYHGLSNEMPVGMEQFSGKKILTLHDVIFMRYPQYYGNIDKYVYKKKTAYALNIADRVIAISNQTKSDALHFFNCPADKISVLGMDCDPAFRNPVDEAQARLILAKYDIRTPYILNVGTFEPRKNQKTLLRAFALLKKDNLSLVCIGKHTSYADEVLSLTKELGVEHQVKLLHDVPNHYLPALFTNAAVFVYPSEFEGFGIPVLEAICCGVPVVTSNVSSMPEVAGNAALLVNPADDREMGQAINRILEDNNLAQQLTAKGQDRASDFRSNILAGEVMKLYTLK